MILRYVNPSEVDAMWPLVVPMIHKGERKVRGTADIEDVKRELDSSKAGLFMLDDGDGFMIARRLEERGRGIFFVWMLYSMRLWDRFEALVDEIDALAKAMNCDIIRFQSSRRGWKRSRWVEETAAVFERKVPT